jgi:small multidrug resistance family-3 protein
MNTIAWLIFIAAALLEVSGDAAVRRGLRGGGLAFIIAGWVAMGWS